MRQGKISFHIALITITILIFTSCASVTSEWNKTRMEDKKALYNEFIEKYPESEYTELAKQRLDSLAWDLAFKNFKINESTRYTHYTAIKALKSYLKEYPEGIFSDTAKFIIDDTETTIKILTDSLEWTMHEDSDLILSFRSYFIGKNRLKQYKDSAIAKIEEELASDYVVLSKPVSDSLEDTVLDYASPCNLPMLCLEFQEMEKGYKSRSLEFLRSGTTKYTEQSNDVSKSYREMMTYNNGIIKIKRAYPLTRIYDKGMIYLEYRSENLGELLILRLEDYITQDFNFSETNNVIKNSDNFIRLFEPKEKIYKNRVPYRHIYTGREKNYYYFDESTWYFKNKDAP